MYLCIGQLPLFQNNQIFIISINQIDNQLECVSASKAMPH